ncbi:hypothetical protein HUJ05_007984 [Dendroctonus ponderosae]|nr:hypothetical protein HUJ05_007984 [Dendroctonus ponderosae]
MKTLLIIVTVCVIKTVTSSVASQDWKDPHDMNTNAKQKYLRSSSLDSSFGNGAEKSQATDSLNTYLFNLKRIVSVLMKAAHIDKENPDLYQGHIRFAIKPEDHQFLLNFGKEDITLDTLRDLNAIFSEGFQKSYIDGYLDNVKSFQSQLYSAVVNIETLWIFGTAYMVYFVHQLMKNGFSLAYMSKFIILLVLITDFGFRHYHLVQETEEHNFKVVYSSKCDTTKMSWTEWTKFLFGSEECEKRSVTPLDTLLHQVKHLIIIPMHAVGTGMGGFGTNLPFPINFIMWPMMLIFTLLLALITLTVLSGHPIEFNIFHLIKMKFGDTGKNYNSLTNSKMFMDKVEQRPIVHNVNISLTPAAPANNELKQEKMRIDDVSDPPLEHTLAEHADRLCNPHAEDSALEKTPKRQNLIKTVAKQILAADKDLSSKQPAGIDFNIFHSIKPKLSDAEESDNNLSNSNSKICVDEMVHRTIVHNVDVSQPPAELAHTEFKGVMRIEDVSDSPLEHILAGDDDLSCNKPAEDSAHEKTCSPEADVDTPTPKNLSKTVAESPIKYILVTDAGLSCNQLAEYSVQEETGSHEADVDPSTPENLSKTLAESPIKQILAAKDDCSCNQPAEDSAQEKPGSPGADEDAQTPDNLSKTRAESLIKEMFVTEADLSCNQPGEDSAHEKAWSSEADEDFPAPENLFKTLAESRIEEILATKADPSCNQPAEDSALEKTGSPLAHVGASVLEYIKLNKTFEESIIKQILAPEADLACNQPGEDSPYEKACSSEADVDFPTPRLIYHVTNLLKEVYMKKFAILSLMHTHFEDSELTLLKIAPDKDAQISFSATILQLNRVVRTIGGFEIECFQTVVFFVTSTLSPGTVLGRTYGHSQTSDGQLGGYLKQFVIHQSSIPGISL